MRFWCWFSFDLLYEWVGLRCATAVTVHGRSTEKNVGVPETMQEPAFEARSDEEDEFHLVIDGLQSLVVNHLPPLWRHGTH